MWLLLCPSLPTAISDRYPVESYEWKVVVQHKSDSSEEEALRQYSKRIAVAGLKMFVPEFSIAQPPYPNCLFDGVTYATQVDCSSSLPFGC
jgi:hypothetical protein